MAATTVNAKNLAALGTERLAALLLALAADDAAIKRRLRLELAGAASPAAAAREIRNRLAAIGRSRSFVEGPKRRALLADLDTQYRAILEQVAPDEPGEALDLLWRFTALAEPVLARCDDRGGVVVSAFHLACRDIARLAERLRPDPEGLAERTFEAVRDNGYGQYDGLIGLLAPALGPAGLAALKARVAAFAREPRPVPQPEDRAVLGWSAEGPLYADESLLIGYTVAQALRDIADAEGDVDGFIAQQSAKARTVPAVAAEIAARLLAAGRAEEAWAAINAADTEHGLHAGEHTWQETRLAVMEALGMAEAAQAFRWDCFARALDPSPLREYLKRLPDFEDIAAEDRALALAEGDGSVHRGLWFLIHWPALDRAAALVLARATELDGDFYEILAPAAEALDAGHPLAATLLRRAMIDFTLAGARHSRYRHAARDLLECRSLAARVADFGSVPPHEAYLARLRAENRRKPAFWSLVDGAA